MFLDGFLELGIALRLGLAGLGAMGQPEVTRSGVVGDDLELIQQWLQDLIAGVAAIAITRSAPIVVSGSPTVFSTSAKAGFSGSR